MDKKIKYLFKVKEADEETNDIGQFEMDGVIFVAELMNRSIDDLVEFMIMKKTSKKNKAIWQQSHSFLWERFPLIQMIKTGDRLQ